MRRNLSQCDPSTVNECTNPAHTSLDCYPKYRQLEDEGQGVMSVEQWERI